MPEPSITVVVLPPVDRPRHRLVAAWRAAGSAVEWVVGVGALVAGLAALAAVPVVQLVSLGYLLEASGRVARGGRLRDAAIGVRRAARVGRVVAGCLLWSLPARLVASLAASAAAIDPAGPTARGWRWGLGVLVALTLLHLAASCARGGRLCDFAWPLGSLIWLAQRARRGGLYAEARDATCDFVAALRLPHYFRLGLLGFLGALAWLAVPTAFLASGERRPVLGLAGGLMLAVVAPGLPFLQVRLAAEGRFGAIFEVGAVRERFRRAPWAFAAAFLLTILAAAPLYLLKVERVPREVVGLVSVLFVVALFPARVACGWAYARGGRRADRRHWLGRGLGRLAMLAGAAAYVVVVSLARYTSWGGTGTLFEQHAFLIPVPFPIP